MTAIAVEIACPGHEKIVLDYNIDGGTRKEHLEKLQEGLKRIQTEVNDKLTEFVNKDKELNGASADSKMGKQKNNEDLGEEDDDEEEDDEEEDEEESNKEPDKKKVKTN